MKPNRLADYLAHMQQAANDACSHVAGMHYDDFLTDRRTQQAVTMCLIIIGEAASNVMDHFADFAKAHPEIPWHNMRGMRNRIAHGYFDINFNVVWETVQTAFPVLLSHLRAIETAGDTGSIP